MRILLLGSLLALLCACGGERQAITADGDGGAAVSAQGHMGAGDPLQAYRGQWLFINYWAEWCAPCIKEIPELNELDHASDDVTVVGVNFDGAEGESLQAQIDKLGVGFETLRQDPAASLGLPRPAVLPTTIILDPEGGIHATLVGPQTLATLNGAIGR